MRTSVSSNRFNGPPMPAPLTMVPAAGPFGISFEGLEVTQAVQDMAHSVPLVAGKATVVRLYLGTTTNVPITARGVLRVKAAGSDTWTQVASIRPVLLNPAENGHLRLKRETLDKSLNFILPQSATIAGTCNIALFQVQQVTPPGDVLPVPANASRVVEFKDTPPLRVRVVGVRYRDPTRRPTRTYEPSAKDFILIRSWLSRAYPVSSLAWTQAVVDGPNAWPFEADQNNAFIRALRAQDMALGGDRRTHYFGLVDDAAGRNFMRGLASGIPSNPDPSTVASGPTGTRSFGWDIDGCYGDWYTAHELAHTFGRYHAEFCGADGGIRYPYPNGQLAHNNGDFVGFDFGDADNGVPMKALPGVVWHDVMTYCANQWVSSFTYAGIRDRIVAEGRLPAGFQPAVTGAEAAPQVGGPAVSILSIHVVAIVNSTKNTATFQFVNPLPAASAAQGPTPASDADAKYKLRLSKGDGALIGEYPAAFYPDACTDHGHDATGLIDATVPAHAEAVSLELVHEGKVLATYRPGAAPAQPRDIRSTREVGSSLVEGVDANRAMLAIEDPVIAWNASAGTALEAREAATSSETYTVQISTDDEKSWTTIGIGLKDPHVKIDRTLLEGAKMVKMRVTATNGFRAVAATQTLEAKDL